MSEQELEYFNLCRKLAELLGGDKAVADINKLYNRHPEMFKDKQEVSRIIKVIVNEPEIIVDARRDERYDVYKAIKELDNGKMGDVIIKNESKINEIFHANQKRIGGLNSLKDKNLLQVETPTPSTDQNVKQNGVELIDKNLSGTNQSNINIDTNALSAIDESIIPQSQQKQNTFISKIKQKLQKNKESNEFIPNKKTKVSELIDFLKEKIIKFDFEEEYKLSVTGEGKQVSLFSEQKQEIENEKSYTRKHRK